MNVYVVGSATTKFGELWSVSPRSLARQAVQNALKQAEMHPAAVEALYVGNMLSGILGGQEHLGAFFAEELGLSVPAYKIEGACASGGLAFHNAVLSVLSGQFSTVLVLGVEKMTDHKPEDVAVALMGAGSDEERLSGATFPGLYAIMARAHMHEFGTTEKDLAAVAVKNHYHASFNPDAQFPKEISIEEVLSSSCIADPLKLLDCSPISDGAAAVIISSKRPERSAVRIAASQAATDTLGVAQRKSLVELFATKSASLKAYRQAAVQPQDIDVCEVHDCFTIAEILALEDLDILPKGKAAERISNGFGRLGSKKGCVVNTSGGLKACGHPVGATGVKQIAEVYVQLTGRAGKRQVENASVGLTHNVGGSGATAVVHIFIKE